MPPKLSPYSVDLGRYTQLLTRPNIGYPAPTGPHDEVFPDSGLLHLPGAIEPGRCDAAIAEYVDFERLREANNCVISDENQRHFRVANLHLKSPALLEIGLSSAFHENASRFFGARSTIYTSLYFKHGSQQNPHIDTPFFWTRPFNLFVGVWVALEDVQEDAGPLIYYPGSHRLFSSEDQLSEVFHRAGSDVQKMFALMQSRVEESCAREVVKIRKGDAVIWHPGLMHGGSLARNGGLTRQSAVFHFAPLGVNVRDHRVFPKDFINMPTYGVVSENGGHYCRASLPKAMI